MSPERGRNCVVVHVKDHRQGGRDKVFGPTTYAECRKFVRKNIAIPLKDALQGRRGLPEGYWLNRKRTGGELVVECASEHVDESPPVEELTVARLFQRLVGDMALSAVRCGASPEEVRSALREVATR